MEDITKVNLSNLSPRSREILERAHKSMETFDTKCDKLFKETEKMFESSTEKMIQGQIESDKSIEQIVIDMFNSHNK